MNAKRHDTSPSRSATPDPQGRDAGMPPTPTVLVADDDPDMRLYVKRCLRSILPTDAVVLEAADGIEALVRVRRGDVDLLISDVVMPRSDGLELCRAVRGDSSLTHVSILLVTGELSVRDIKSCAREFGPVQVICKPFNADQLNAKVREMLGAAASDPDPDPDPETDSDSDPENGP